MLNCWNPPTTPLKTIPRAPAGAGRCTAPIFGLTEGPRAPSIIIDEKKRQNLDAGDNLVGDVTQEFSLETEFIKKSGWGIFLASCVNKWVEFETRKKVKEFK